MSKVSRDIAAKSREILRVFVWWSLTVYTWLYFFSSDVILIRHLHVSPSASYSPPPTQILHNLCFSFLLGITAVPREKQCLCIIVGGNKVHYGRCASGEFNILYKLST